MLTKLLRYEFKSTGRVVLPIAAGVRFGAYPVFIITSVLALGFELFV